MASTGSSDVNRYLDGGIQVHMSTVDVVRKAFKEDKHKAERDRAFK